MQEQDRNQLVTDHAPANAGVIVFVATAVAVILYLGIRELLSLDGLEFQTKIVIPGEVLTFLVLPAEFVTLVVTAVLRTAKSGRTGARMLAAVVCTLAALTAFLYLTVGSLFYVLLRAPKIEQERWIGENHAWIEGKGEENMGLESWPVWHLYEPVAGVLKRRLNTVSDVMEWKARERYGETFVVVERDRARELDGPLSIYRLYPSSDPELVMHMLSGNTYYGYANDYPQAYANRVFSQDAAFCGIAEFAPAIDPAEAETLTDCFAQTPVVMIQSKLDGWRKAGVIARAIDAATENGLFHMEGNTASVTLRFQYEDGTTQDVKLPFGNQASHQVNDRTNGMVHETWYADVEHIRETVSSWYRDAENQPQEPDGAGGSAPDDGGTAGDGAPGNNPDDEGADGDGAPDSDTAEQEGDPFETSDPETVEGAYRCLYEEVFEPLGDDYDCRYNAKGNFYAVLSHGRGIPAEGLPEMDTERTVVYDRISKNGECHLFVCYETWYDESGSEYTTAIRNSYAVNRTTGEVTASGKHSWEQAGSEEYQEAAGEP